MNKTNETKQLSFTYAVVACNQPHIKRFNTLTHSAQCVDTLKTPINKGFKDEYI